MDAFEAVRRLNARRNAILDHLPPHLLKELEAIDKTIREIDAVLLKHGHGVEVTVPASVSHAVDDTAQPRGRVSLTQRRGVLLKFLAERGAATRAEIVAQTGIPAGTLSALLSGPEFESTDHGWWRLKSPLEPDTE